MVYFLNDILINCLQDIASWNASLMSESIIYISLKLIESGSSSSDIELDISSYAYIASTTSISNGFWSSIRSDLTGST
jgi:hypothetical protein